MVPCGAHVRKVYPRDQKDPGELLGDATRILRRGIPFGRSYREFDAVNEPADGPEFPDDRGLLFICYHNSIEEKFEALQQTWANDHRFPERLTESDPQPGQDPIIAQKDDRREFDIPGKPSVSLTKMEQWVTTTGGDYFFSPSIRALGMLAGNL